MAKKLPKAIILKGKKPKANDEYENFEDELTLAQLMQNAGARGLTSIRGTLFAKPFVPEDEYAYGEYEDDHGNQYDAVMSPKNEDQSVNPKVKRLATPPEGATCACALGAQLLSPKIDRPLRTTQVTVANDAGDESIIEVYVDARDANIGAAYEQAMRP